MGLNIGCAGIKAIADPVRMDTYLEIGCSVPKALMEDGVHEFKGGFELRFKRSQMTYVRGIAVEYTNAFLNTEGGHLYFGIDDDGTVSGVPCDRYSVSNF